MLESELRIEIVNTFQQLTQAIWHLCDAIKLESALIAWVQDSENAREKACEIFSQLQYLDNQAPREILICAGFIGASQTTLDLVQKVNHCKARFKQSVLALKQAKISTEDPLLELKKMGLARLHLKQCYRQIPILKEVPHKISWTWANTRSIKKITVAKAQELLLKKGEGLNIEMQLKKLGALSPHEPLAIVQELAPHLRANIVFKKDDIISRTMIKGPVPIFFPCQTQTPFPQFNPPTKKSGRNQNRSIRSDVQLDPNSYLPAIRAHRYRVQIKHLF